MAYTTIDNPELYFQVKTYSGNSSTQSITLDGSENMQPDWVIIKNRGAANNWRLADSVRSADNSLMTNLANEASDLADTITSFDSDGFSLGNNGSYVNDINATSNNYVAFCWKESATAGFDILSHTGTGSAHTISHNLSAKPRSIMNKGVSHDHAWTVQHGGIGATFSLVLNTAAGKDDSATQWNDTEPTSSVFTVGTNGQVNTNTSTYITYLNCDIQGFSKFGQYEGSGSTTDNTFVYTGFAPAMIIVKAVDTDNQWNVFDNKRNTRNPKDARIWLDSSDAETSYASFDFLSNGFKVRNNSVGIGTADTFVYWAWARAPLVNSSGAPGNAV